MDPQNEAAIDATGEPVDQAQKEKSHNILRLILSAVAILFFLFCQFLFGFGALAYVAVEQGLSGPNEAEITALMSNLELIAVPTIVSVLISNLFVLSILWFFLRKEGRLERMGWYRWSAISWWKTLLLAILVIALALGFNFAYAEYIFPDIEMQAGMRELIAAIPQTLPNQILLFVTIAVVAPFVEEVVFRGMLQRSLTAFMPAWVSIPLAALIFAAIHFQPEAIGALMALGMAFGIIYHVTKSLKVTILLHLANNAMALLLQPFAEEALQAEQAGFILPMLLFNVG